MGRHMKTMITMTALGAAAISLAACQPSADDQREDQLEAQADAVEENAEQKADAMENQADQVRENAEQQADAIEQKADN